LLPSPALPGRGFFLLAIEQASIANQAMQTMITVSDDLIRLVRKLDGAKGGRSRSAKKLAAANRNVRKAWAARRKQKKAA
jgi:hypothetical protein